MTVNRTIRLIKGEVYFYCTFYDSDFTYPCIQTFIYDGVDEEFGHMFKNLSEDNAFYTFPIGEIHGIYDKQKMSDWVMKLHNDNLEYEYVY